MAVYEHTYKRYSGELTPTWSRFLIIPRHAYRAVFQSKLFMAFFVACFIAPLVFAILIYLHHNVNALGILQASVDEIVPINGSFFQTLIGIQGILAFFLTLLVGPPLVSRDLTNNGLPLYLCRPFSRAEYVIGKMSVVIILSSLITWVPGLLLFLFQAYLEGGGWLKDNLWIAYAIWSSSWVWIILFALLSQAISAWVKWRVVASAALLGVYFISTVIGGIINGLFRTRLGNLISLGALLANVTAGLFRTFTPTDTDVQEFRNGRVVRQVLINQPPLWSHWLMLALICLFCLWLLYTRVRAYEVVR
ncbi:MAG TPA: ABC transporter permease subunit [Pyrinomonadaceae bacterium]|jgi:ABC-2 type transport system permease protein